MSVRRGSNDRGAVRCLLLANYVVGSESALRAMPEDDEALSIIDLRERDEPVDARKIDLRDGVRGVNQRHATVLLAQYGLPLVAFDAS